MAEDPGPLLAMVALGSARMPTGSEIVAEFTSNCPVGPTATACEERNETIILDLHKGFAFVSLMPAPIPWSDLEGPCETSWWWPEATERMKCHTHHAIVALMAPIDDPTQRHIWLSHLVSAVAKKTDAVGVYWGNGTVVHDPADFQELVADLALNDVEPRLWIDMRLEQNEDGSYRFFTTGMTAFERAELEIDRSQRHPKEILEFTYQIISYLLNGGVNIADGETIGRSEEEKICITYGPSMWERERKVMKLAFV
jgi:hypothetical protein